MKASDLMVKCLENEGVKYLFGVPGEENLDFVESLRHSKIQLVLTRHEQTAGFMAATIGRLTGVPGVCLSTLGPGATNLVTAAAYAQLGAMPMCMITGQKPIHSSKQGHFQIIDTVGMMRPLTKHTKQVVRGGRIPAIVRESFALASGERPGAVHIELPEDVAAEETAAQPFPVHPVRRPDANEKAVATAAEWIEQAHSPLILLGAGANRKLVSKMLMQFVERTGIPFFSTQMGKGVLPEDHPLCLGTAALSDRDYLHCAIERSDLILNFGHDVVEKPPFFMKPGGTRVIHINFSEANVDDIYFPHLEVVGDIANAVWQLNERVRVSPRWDFSYFMKVKTHMDAKIAERADSDSFPVLPQRLVADVRGAMGPCDIVALDNGMYKIWFARNYRAWKPNTLLLDNALATMGAGLPSAMAAKMVYPERKVMAVCGDGGFMMNSQELETAVRLELDLVVLILNSSGYGMIKWKQAGMGFQDFGLDFGNPDFVKYAEAYGAHGHRINQTSELRPKLVECLNAKGVHVIEVAVDYSENTRVLTQELNEKACII
ncbi:MAG: acetolactate synthase [Holophagaceae bacterium]|nr:acetolactate synthase [Holophagaceae bacterium]